MQLFITGTGTDVGKTFISAGLAWQICHQRKNKFTYLKPIASGVINNDNTDIEYVKNIICSFRQASTQCWYTYREPASPFIAAQAEQKVVPYDKILEQLASIDQESSDILAEGAGGIFVPLTKDKMVIDLIVDFKWPVVIVAHYGLGTVNHTALTVAALKQRNCNIVGIILNQPEKVERESFVLAAHTNQAEIERVTGIEVLGIVPFGDKPDSKNFADIWKRLSNLL